MKGKSASNVIVTFVFYTGETEDGASMLLFFTLFFIVASTECVTTCPFIVTPSLYFPDKLMAASNGVVKQTSVVVIVV